MKKKSRDLTYGANDLRKMIVENPDLPLVFFAEQSDNFEDCYISCSGIKAEIGEALFSNHPFYKDCIYVDRDLFKEDLEYYYGDIPAGTIKKFDEFIAKELEEYEPFWKKAIVVYVDN